MSPGKSSRPPSALAALHRRITRLRDAGRLGARTIPEAAWDFHAACEGLAVLELRCILAPEHGQRLWKSTLSTLSALVAGWQHVTPGATPRAPANTRQPGIPASRSTTIRSGEAGNDLRPEY